MNYIGQANNGCRVIGPNGPIDLHREVVAYSDSFSWGGMSLATYQTAIAVLTEVLDADAAKKHHNAFAERFLNDVGRTWLLSAEEIKEWIKEGAHPCKKI